MCCISRIRNHSVVDAHVKSPGFFHIHTHFYGYENHCNRALHVLANSDVQVGKGMDNGYESK